MVCLVQSATITTRPKYILTREIVRPDATVYEPFTFTTVCCDVVVYGESRPFEHDIARIDTWRSDGQHHSDPSARHGDTIRQTTVVTRYLGHLCPHHFLSEKLRFQISE